MQNQGVQKNNKSGVTGVRWDTQKNKWVAQITANKEKMYLGALVNKNDAIRTRLEAEAQYFKEFAPQRHLFEQYGITTQHNELNINK